MSQVGKFTRLDIESNISLINDILDHLQDGEIDKREQFLDLTKTVFGEKLKLDARALANDMSVNYGRVLKWTTGKIAPQISLRGFIISWIRNALDEKRRELREKLAV